MNKICEIVTEHLISEMEKGIVPWQRPWSMVRGGAISHLTGKPYSMLNQWLLSQEGEYLTFNQVRAENGRIIKGSKAELIVFFKPHTVSDTDKDGKKVDKIIPLLRHYMVFNINDTEGIKPKFVPEVMPKSFDPIEEAERVISEFCKRENIVIKYTPQNNAFYSPLLDTITLPMKEQFIDRAEYYSTVLHEASHATGHNTRLNRFSADSIWHESKDDYSKEELIAEISASTIMATLGIETPSSFKNSAAYIQSWIKALRNDKSLIIRASGKSEQAVEYILNQEHACTEESNDEDQKSALRNG